MDLDRGAGLLHRLTSFSPAGAPDWDSLGDDPRLRHDLVPNDPATLPPQVKTYPAGLPVIPLPRDLPQPGMSATAVLAGAPAPAQPLDAAQLGRVLFLGGGVVRTCSTPSAGGCCSARPAPRAGSSRWRSMQAPVASPVCRTASTGTTPSRTPSCRSDRPRRGDVTTLIVTGVPWRTGWRYAERGWRHLYWDGGTLLSQLIAAAASAGFEPRLRTRFPDARVRDLVGADGVLEYPLALLSLGDGRSRRRGLRPRGRRDAPPR